MSYVLLGILLAACERILNLLQPQHLGGVVVQRVLQRLMFQPALVPVFQALGEAPDGIGRREQETVFKEGIGRRRVGFMHGHVAHIEIGVGREVDVAAQQCHANSFLHLGPAAMREHELDLVPLLEHGHQRRRVGVGQIRPAVHAHGDADRNVELLAQIENGFHFGVVAVNGRGPRQCP